MISMFVKCLFIEVPYHSESNLLMSLSELNKPRPFGMKVVALICATFWVFVMVMNGPDVAAFWLLLVYVLGEWFDPIDQLEKGKEIKMKATAKIQPETVRQMALGYIAKWIKNETDETRLAALRAGQKEIEEATDAEIGTFRISCEGAVIRAWRETKS